MYSGMFIFFFFQAEDGIRDPLVTGVQTCALPIFMAAKLRNYAFTRLWPRIEQLDPSALQLDECMRVLWKIGRFEATKVQVEQSALEIERERVGEPTRRQVDV